MTAIQMRKRKFIFALRKRVEKDRSFTVYSCAKIICMSTTYALQARLRCDENSRYSRHESGESDDGIGLRRHKFGERAAGVLTALCINNWLLRRLKVTSMNC
jgi:hypothetical protein